MKPHNSFPKTYEDKDSFDSFNIWTDWKMEEIPPKDVKERIRAVFICVLICN